MTTKTAPATDKLCDYCKAPLVESDDEWEPGEIIWDCPKCGGAETFPEDPEERAEYEARLARRRARAR